MVDYHALTSTHDPDELRRGVHHVAATLLALGLDPEACTLFVQSHRPEHTELAWLLATVTPVSWVERTPTYKEKKQFQPDDVNHALLTYPILQAADIVLYKASRVPVGKDQAAHLELSREIVRSFNNRYGQTFPEPQAVFTEAPVVLGTDGVRKMSKSLGNTIEILAEPDLIRRQVMSMVTDTQRILRTDPGRPEVCNVCQLHRFFGDDWEEIQDGERTARTGCVDTKKLLAPDHPPLRAGAERYLELIANPAEVEDPRGGRRSPGRWPRPRWTRSASGWASAKPIASLAEGAIRRRTSAARRARIGTTTMSGPATGPSPPRTEATRDVDPGPSRVQFEPRRGSVSFRRVPRARDDRARVRRPGVPRLSFRSWQDIILMFFLAWLLSFALLPLIELVDRMIPRAPKWVAVILVYTVVVLIFLGLLISAAASLANSIAQFIQDTPNIQIR